MVISIPRGGGPALDQPYPDRGTMGTDGNGIPHPPSSVHAEKTGRKIVA
jgi:hypothetical protein